MGYRKAEPLLYFAFVQDRIFRSIDTRGVVGRGAGAHLYITPRKAANLTRELPPGTFAKVGIVVDTLLKTPLADHLGEGFGQIAGIGR